MTRTADARGPGHQAGQDERTVADKAPETSRLPAQLPDQGPNAFSDRDWRKACRAAAPPGTQRTLTDLHPGAAKPTLMGKHLATANAIQMPHLRARCERQRSSGGKREAEERVFAWPKIFGEPVSTLECFAADEQVAAGGVAERAPSLRHPFQVLQRVGDRAPTFIRGSVEYRTRNHLDLRSQGTLERVEPPGLWDRVGVQERKQFATSDRRAEIASPPGQYATWEPHESQPWPVHLPCNLGAHLVERALALRKRHSYGGVAALATLSEQRCSDYEFH